MILIVGLGNPGSEYENTRHNIGRDFVKSFAKDKKVGDLTPEKKFKSLVAKGAVEKEKIVLAAPETFMNKSGQAVAPLALFYKIKPARIFVIHDDTDLKLGQTKLSFGKHSAGHKGVESVIKALKTMKFWRLRVGVAGKKDIPAEKIILRKFTPEETKLIKKISKKTAEALDLIVSEGPEKAMNEYNQN